MYIHITKITRIQLFSAAPKLSVSILMMALICFSRGANSAAVLSKNPYEAYEENKTTHLNDKAFSSQSKTYKHQRPFTHYLETGLKFRGIQLTSNLYLVKHRQADDSARLGICLKTGKILYRLSPKLISVALKY